MNRSFLGILAVVWLVCSGFSFAATKIYKKAEKFAKSGQDHFAFMQFNNLLRTYPDSKYRKLALFATGEYYFQVADYLKAQAAFQEFLKEEPEPEERLYALAYLLGIASKTSAPMDELEREIVDLQQVSFIFRDKKETTYRSPLHQKYKTVNHIDKIEFYVEGKLFAQVSY